MRVLWLTANFQTSHLTRKESLRRKTKICAPEIYGLEEAMKKIGSWKGYRHSHGLKVRGQKTRTTGRTRKTLGVKKKKIITEKRKL